MIETIQKRLPVFQYLVAFGVNLAGRVITFPGPTDVRLDMQWPAVLITAVILPLPSALTGICLASLVCHLWIIPRVEIDVYGIRADLYELLFTAGMMAGVLWIDRFRCRLRTGPAVRMVLIGSPLVLGIWVAIRAGGYTWVYAAASIVISILAAIKSRHLGSGLWIFLSAWIIGYGLFLLVGWAVNVDLNSAESSVAYLQRLFLTVYPVYLLEILVAAYGGLIFRTGDPVQ
ncbi:hypothetical protein JXA40_03190 [bacterium]|nr:hypothetical protein [candidate division CSSED10-310 bacterium]